MIYALHGFLGLPSDWDFLKGLGALSSPEIYKNVTDYKTWARQFNASVNTEQRNILIGYSLGGRLALHALIDQPTLWHKGIIISSHPGISQKLRQERIQQDERWAQRFESESWDSLMKDWNRQSVFCGIPSPILRLEHQFHRKELASTLRQFSLGQQEDFSEAIAKLHIPILWIAGENDLRYKELAISQHLSHSASFKWIAPNAGHRVPWESQNSFYEQVAKFIS